MFILVLSKQHASVRQPPASLSKDFQIAATSRYCNSQNMIVIKIQDPLYGTSKIMITQAVFVTQIIGSTGNGTKPKHFLKLSQKNVTRQ